MSYLPLRPDFVHNFLEHSAFLEARFTALLNTGAITQRSFVMSLDYSAICERARGLGHLVSQQSSASSALELLEHSNQSTSRSGTYRGAELSAGYKIDLQLQVNVQLANEGDERSSKRIKIKHRYQLEGQKYSDQTDITEGGDELDQQSLEGVSEAPLERGERRQLEDHGQGTVEHPIEIPAESPEKHYQDCGTQTAEGLSNPSEPVITTSSNLSIASTLPQHRNNLAQPDAQPLVERLILIMTQDKSTPSSSQSWKFILMRLEYMIAARRVWEGRSSLRAALVDFDEPADWPSILSHIQHQLIHRAREDFAERLMFNLQYLRRVLYEWRYVGPAEVRQLLDNCAPLAFLILGRWRERITPSELYSQLQHKTLGYGSTFLFRVLFELVKLQKSVNTKRTRSTAITAEFRRHLKVVGTALVYQEKLYIFYEKVLSALRSDQRTAQAASTIRDMMEARHVDRLLRNAEDQHPESATQCYFVRDGVELPLPLHVAFIDQNIDLQRAGNDYSDWVPGLRC